MTIPKASTMLNLLTIFLVGIFALDLHAPLSCHHLDCSLVMKDVAPSVDAGNNLLHQEFPTDGNDCCDNGFGCDQLESHDFFTAHYTFSLSLFAPGETVPPESLPHYEAYSPGPFIPPPFFS